MLDADFPEVLISFYGRDGEGEGELSSRVNIEEDPDYEQINTTQYIYFYS